MIEVIQSKANNLAWMRDRQRVFQPIERMARRRRRFLCKSTDRREVTVVPPQDLGEIARYICIHSLQIDDIVAIDHTKPHAVVRFKSDDLHKASVLHE